MLATGTSVHPDLATALRDCRRAFAGVALFSGVVNLLMLAGPLYMLQIYDRVLSSRSVPTLVVLSVFLVGACPLFRHAIYAIPVNLLCAYVGIVALVWALGERYLKKPAIAGI